MHKNALWSDINVQCNIQNDAKRCSGSSGVGSPLRLTLSKGGAALHQFNVVSTCVVESRARRARGVSLGWREREDAERDARERTNRSHGCKRR